MKTTRMGKTIGLSGIVMAMLFSMPPAYGQQFRKFDEGGKPTGWFRVVGKGPQDRHWEESDNPGAVWGPVGIKNGWAYFGHMAGPLAREGEMWIFPISGGVAGSSKDGGKTWQPRYWVGPYIPAYGNDPHPLVYVNKSQITIKTTQTISSDVGNPTQNPSTQKITLSTKASMQKNSTLEKIREDTTTTKLGAEVSTEFEASSGSEALGGESKVKGEVKVTSEYETFARRYLSATTAEERFKSTESERSVEFTVEAHGKLTIYENTTSGGGFTKSYLATEKQKAPVADQTVTITSTNNLNPIFNKFLDTVIWCSGNTNADSGMWESYGSIALEAKKEGDRGFYKYLDAVLDPGFSPKSDNGAWDSVKAAAQKAKDRLTNGEKKEALMEVLLGFHQINNPSHNAGLWGKLREPGTNWLKMNVE